MDDGWETWEEVAPTFFFSLIAVANICQAFNVTKRLIVKLIAVIIGDNCKSM